MRHGGRCSAPVPVASPAPLPLYTPRVTVSTGTKLHECIQCIGKYWQAVMLLDKYVNLDVIFRSIYFYYNARTYVDE